MKFLILINSIFPFRVSTTPTIIPRSDTIIVIELVVSPIINE